MKAFFLCLRACSVLCLLSLNSYAAISYISLQEAEDLALKTSNEIKVFTAQTNAANEQVGVKFASLLPYWTVEGFYQYSTYVPSVSFPVLGITDSFKIGTHTAYSIGTTLTYNLWHWNSDLNAYESAKYFAHSQKETEENTKLKILLDTRLTYLSVQLSLEELTAVENALNLARSQFNDMDKRYKGGTVAKLDWIDSKREVLSYELQYEQQRVAVTNNVKNLFALLLLPTTVEALEPEVKPGVPENAIPKIKFDSLEDTLKKANTWSSEAPTDKQPALYSQTLLAQSYFAQADSEWGKLWPKIDLYANSQLQYPYTIQLAQEQQNIFRASVSMPVFDGNRIRHQVSEYRQNGLAAQFNHDQIKINFDRDYEKNIDTLKNLQIQKEINELDIEAAKNSAKLYYESYQAGKSLLVNVQRANLQVLVTEVQSARISANMLNQIFQLQYLSGKLPI